MLKQFEKKNVYFFICFIIDVVVINSNDYIKFFIKINKTSVSIEEFKRLLSFNLHSYINC